MLDDVRVLVQILGGIGQRLTRGFVGGGIVENTRGGPSEGIRGDRESLAFDQQLRGGADDHVPVFSCGREVGDETVAGPGEVDQARGDRTGVDRFVETDVHGASKHDLVQQ